MRRLLTPRITESKPPDVTYKPKVFESKREPITYKLATDAPNPPESVSYGTVAYVTPRSEERSALALIPMDRETAFEILEDAIESAATALDMPKLTQARAALAYLRQNLRSAAA